jgi:hypothetical protein
MKPTGDLMVESMRVSKRRNSSDHWMRLVAALFTAMAVFMIPCTASAQARRFAVEVLRMRSMQGAQTLTDGLVARGYQAYWVQLNRAGSEARYGVRIGKFQNSGLAQAYATRLLNSGLLNSCAITVQNPLQPEGAAKTENKPVDFQSALQQVGWKLSANEQLAYSLPRRGRATSDIVLLMRAVENNSWRLRADSEILNLTAGKISAGANPGARIDAVAADSLTALASASNPRGVLNAELEVPDSNPVEIKSLRRAGAPMTPPRLRGTVEMNGTQLFMRLKNLDRQIPFNGTARVTISDGKNENEMIPILVNLRPNEERVVPIDSPMLAYGDSVLIVYDGKRAIQLIRSVPFGDRPTPAVQSTIEPAPEPKVIGIEMAYDSLGEDDPPAATSVTAANETPAVKQPKPPSVTDAFEGEIEGAPAQNKPKPIN